MSCSYSNWTAFRGPRPRKAQFADALVSLPGRSELNPRLFIRTSSTRRSGDGAQERWTGELFNEWAESEERLEWVGRLGARGRVRECLLPVMGSCCTRELTWSGEQGAFLRGASRPGVSNASSSSYLPPNSESRQGGQNGRPAPGSRRNGTPRLGGLGLGGVGLSSPPGSPARSKAPPPSRPNYPFPPPPQPSTSSANGNRTSSTRDSSSELVRPEHFDPSSTSPPTFPSRVPPNPFPDVNSINQRPFLSPEMAKPTLRAGAFALDRPVPDGRSTTTTTTVEPPSSPTSPNSSTFDSSAENSKAIPVRQRVDSTSSLQATVANGELFGGLQATLEGEEGGQEEEEKEELLVEGGKDRHRDEDEDEDDDLETTCAPQSVEVDDDLASAPSPTLSPPSPEAPLPPSLTSFAPPPLPSTPPRPVSSALPSTPEAAPLLVETASQTPIHIRGTSLIDTLPQEDVPVLQAADRTSTGSSATGTTNSSGPATPPVLLDSAPIVQLAEVPHLIARTDPAFSTFPLVAKIRTVDRRRGSVDSSVEADDSEGASFYNEPTRPLDLANRLPSRTRGPPPPRPKRLRAPVVGGQAMAVQAIAGAGGGGAEYQRELLVTSEETVDSGEGEVANEGRSNGGGSMRGASSSSGRRLEATRGSFYTSSSATSVALSPPSYPPSGPPATPPFAAPLPPRTTSPIVTRLAPPIESTAELLDHFSSATPTLDPSPTMSSTSTMSSSSGFSEASRESFFFHPPPPRTSIDQGLPAAVVPPATVASPLPPPPAAPVPAPTEPTPLVEKRGSYHGLGLRLPSSITPSSPYVTPTPLPSSPPPPPSMALPQPTREAQNIPDPLPTLAPLPISDPLSFASRPSTATPVAAPRPDEKAAATVDTAAPKRVLAVLPPALADTIVDSSPSATATSSNPVDEGETLATVAIGAVVSGSIAVGYTAWRGLSAAASAGSSWGWNRFSVAAPRSASEQDEVVGPSEVVFPGMFRPITPIGDDGDSLSGSDTEEGDTFYHDAEDSDDEAEEERDEDGTESSVISTEWGDIHFPAPEGAFSPSLPRCLACLLFLSTQGSSRRSRRRWRSWDPRIWRRTRGLSWTHRKQPVRSSFLAPLSG